MWPKAIAQLVELAPHIVRLVPLADRFLQSKTATDESSRKAMDAMAEGLRGDLGQVTASHAGLYRQLNEQSEKLSVISIDIRGIRSNSDAMEARLRLAENQLATTTKMLAFVLLLNVVGLLLLIVLLLHRH